MFSEDEYIYWQSGETHATTLFRWHHKYLMADMFFLTVRIIYTRSLQYKKYLKRYVNDTFIGEIFQIKSVYQLFSKIVLLY